MNGSLRVTPFSHVIEEIHSEILNLSYKKSTRKIDIPAKVLKDSTNVCSNDLDYCHSCLEKGPLPDDLKITDVLPIFKK